MILCIGTTPALQRVMVFRALKLDAVNRATTTLDGAAGKSVNVAKVLKSLGEHPFATGFLGGEHGESVRAVIEARHIEHEFIRVAAPTRQCITVIDQASGDITELVEESRPVDGAHYDQLIQIVRRRAAGCKALVMSGTITPGGPVDLYRTCTQVAHEAGALSVVDAQGSALIEALKAKPGLVKPNRTELAATVGHPLNDQSALVAAMRELHERGAQRVVVTAGKDPTLAFDGDRVWSIQPPAITPVNPIGSGDSTTAALVWRLLRGDDLGEAARWAAAAGAANALSLMPGELDAGDVERLAGQTTVSRFQ
jgi:1-phosphofructokinase family hexose kinase